MIIRESKKGVIVLGGFIQGLSLVRSFAELGIPVYVANDQDCIARYSKYCSKFLKSPEPDYPELIGYLIDVAEKERLKDWLIIPTDDLQVENLSKNKSILEKYYKLLIPSQSDLYRIINKRNLLEVAESCGTNIPKTCYFDSIDKAKDFRYPLLVKGNYGCSFFHEMHTKAFIVNYYQELKQVLDTIAKTTDIHDVMIQELIPSRKNEHVVSFTCFADKGDIKSYWMGQKLRSRPIDNGTATLAESIMNKEILLQATPLIKTLQFSGVCEVEFMYDYRDNKWNLIEINPRTWKWVGLAKACGIDYAKMLYRYAYEIEQDFPTSYKVGVKWVDHFTDLVAGVKMIRAKRMTLTDYIKSYEGKVIPAIWSWKDPVPAMSFPVYSIASKFKRLTK